MAKFVSYFCSLYLHTFFSKNKTKPFPTFLFIILVFSKTVTNEMKPNQKNQKGFKNKTQIERHQISIAIFVRGNLSKLDTHIRIFQFSAQVPIDDCERFGGMKSLDFWS